MDDHQRDQVWRNLPARLSQLSIRVRLLPLTPIEVLDWDQETVSDRRGTWVTGAPGAVAAATGVIAAEAVELPLVPTAFVAATRKVYARPFVRPVTVAVVAALPVLTAVCAAEPRYGVIR